MPNRLERTVPPSVTGAISLRDAALAMIEKLDPQWGGFRGLPRQPRVPAFEMLLRAVERGAGEPARSLLGVTLTRMFEGGLYDHIGGGFASQCNDERWESPGAHRRLDDNALLMRLYADAHRRLGDDRTPHILRDVAAFLARELASARGEFHEELVAGSGPDDDGFYRWTAEDFDRVLGNEVSAAMRAFFGVDAPDTPTDPRRSMPTRRFRDDEFCRTHHIDPFTLRMWVAEARCWLFGERDRRPHPRRDNAVVSASNALAISALARAGAILEDADILTLATRAANSLSGTKIDPRGQVSHATGSPTAAEASGGNGQLADHAPVIGAFVDLHGATGDTRWLELAVRVADHAVSAFIDGSTDADHPPAAMAAASALDAATPSPAGTLAIALARLSALTGRADLRERAQRVVTAHQALLEGFSVEAATLIRASDVLAVGVSALVVLLPPQTDPARRRALVRQAHEAALPDDVVVVLAPEGPAPSHLDARIASLGHDVTTPCFVACRAGSCGPRSELAAAAIQGLTVGA